MTVKRLRAESRRSLRAAYERALSLVPATGRVEDLISNVAKAAGRPLRLLPFDLGRSEPTGLWISTDAADYVVFSSTASAAQRTAIVCHELAHMLLQHKPEGEGAQLSALAALAAPNIDPDIARRMLARHGYVQQAEADAEVLATRLVARLAELADRARLTQDTISSRLR